MSRVREARRKLALAPADAFRLLEDPSSLQRLVAGARKIRRFDADWPDRGSRIHHTVGVPPLVIRDHTEVIDVEFPHRLVLHARLRPLGELTVAMTLEDDGRDGSVLTVRETAETGFLAVQGVRQVTQVLLFLRNREIARRFARRSRQRRQVMSSPGFGRALAGLGQPRPDGPAATGA